MASNISVVLTIDNQQYIANLNKAEGATKEFAKEAETSANKAAASFGKIDASTNLLNTNLTRLKGLLVGAAFLGFARSSITMAESITDLSNATGIATSKILAFQKATSLAGGSSETAGKGLTYFYTQIDAARQGVEGAQTAFAKLGIGLGDLANLDEEGLLKKTLEQLAAMPASAAKVALQGELLGKAFRGVTIDQEFLDRLAAGEAGAVKIAEAIRRADELSNQWEESVGKLKIAFLEAFGPILKGLTWMLENIPGITIAMKALAIAVLAVATASGFRALVSVIGMAGRGVDALIGGMAKLKSMGGIAGALRGSTQNAGIGQIRDAASAIGLGVGVAAGVGTQLTGGVETPKEKPKPTGTADVVDAFKGRKDAIDESASAFENANKKQLASIELDTKLIGTSKLYQEQEKARAQINNRSADAIEALTKKKAALTKKEIEGGLGKTIDDNIAKIKEQTKVALEGSDKQVAANNRKQVSDMVSTGLTQKQLEVSKAVADLDFNTASAGLGDYDRALAAVVKKEEDWKNAELARLAAVNGFKTVAEFTLAYPEKVAEVTQQASDAVDKNTAALDRNYASQIRVGLASYNFSEQVKSEKSLTKIYDDIAKEGLGELEKKYYDIRAAARDSATARIQEAIRAKFGEKAAGKTADDLDPKDVRDIINSSNQGVDKLIGKTGDLNKASRTFASGWNKAFKQYADDASNAAKQAERLFNKAFQGIEDLLVDFVKTGKFEWKSFVASMAEELLRSQIKQLLSGIGGALGLGSIGGGDGGPAGTSNDPMYVSIVGGAGAFANPGASTLGSFGNMFGLGGQNPMTPGGGIGGGRQQQGGGIFDGIGNIFGGITNTIGSVIGGVTDTIGSIFGGGGDSGGGFFDGITSLFDGFFANGGSIGAGKFGVVGENGPELVGGPANVTPMAGSTNVTYNINAVDAQSFKAMIARDPSFIHAVAMQGAKGIPGRY